MNVQDKIATYYSNARELIKQNNPKAARAYVLAILNYAVETYDHAKTILMKAKTQVFLDKWIAVSRELRTKGITDFVLKCFGLPTKQEQALPRVGEQPAGRRTKESTTEDKPSQPSLPSDEIDIAGLIDESSKSQGWCAELFEKSKKAVVEISVSDSRVSASGTGFIISKNGFLLTNDHVVFNENTQTYYTKAKMSFSGEKKSYKISVLFSDKKADVALCSFAPDEVGEFTVIKRIPDYSQVLQGADCLAIGNAFGMGLAPFTGVVRFTRNEDGNLVYAAPTNPGDSGGPVLNRHGECIGINKSKTVAVNNVSAEGYANATPMDTIEALLKKWCSHNDIEL